MQTPIVNAGLLYVNGLGITTTSTTVLTVATGAARDSTNVNDITLSAAATITSTTSGLGGLDVGTTGNNTWYAVYVIGDSTGYHAPGVIMSLSTTGPLQPFGYDMFRRVGWTLTDGSAHFLANWQYGSDETRQYFWDVGISELSGGSSATFAEINLATSVPAINTEVMFDITFTPDGATEVAEFLPYGSAASSGMVRFGTGVAGAQVGTVVVPSRLKSGVPTVQYKVASGDTLTLLCTGFKDYL